MDFTINGKPLSSLRVVDLKVELEKRGLPKSGNKNDLIERLSQYLLKQTQNQDMGAPANHPAQEQSLGSPGAQPPNMSLSHGLTDNDFVRDYLKLRETQFASALSEQDAHLQSNMVDQGNHQKVALPGHVESQPVNNLPADVIQSPVPVENQGIISPATNLVSYQETASPQKVASNQEVQQYGQTNASMYETAQDRQTVQTFNTIVEQKADIPQDEPSVEPAIMTDNAGNSVYEDKNVQSAPTKLDDAGKITSDAALTTLDAVQETTGNSTSESLNEKPEIETPNWENSKEKVIDNVQNELIQKVEKEVQGEKENVGTPDCDEIVVSNSPILPDFEETIDEETEKIAKKKDESLPEAPPPDTTFRKLSRPISNDNSTEDQKKKKRQWGRKENKDANKEDEKTADIVSGELLKDIIPDVKPYLEDLSKEEELDHEQETEDDEVNGNELQNTTKNNEDGLNQNKKEDSAPSPRQPSVENSNSSSGHAEKSKTSVLNNLNPERTCVIEVRNLVRPFTLIQFKELLLRTGKINKIEDGGFWIDKIKSHAIVEYESPDEADETVMALDGVKWPSTNPKTLSVTFSTKSVLEKAINENSIPNRNTITNEFSQKMRNKQEPGEQLNKRKHSEKEREVITSNQHEEMLNLKRAKLNNENEIMKDVKSSSPKPKKHLDDLFRKTKALPCIYWMPKQLKEPKS